MAAKKRKVKPIPAGHHTVTPYLACKGAAQAIDFYKKAFGAKEVMRMPGPGGAIGHAEMQIGDARLMLTDEYPDMDFLGPTSRGGTIEDAWGHVWHLATHVKDVSMAELRKRAKEKSQQQ